MPLKKTAKSKDDKDEKREKGKNVSAKVSKGSTGECLWLRGIDSRLCLSFDRFSGCFSNALALFNLN